MKSIVRPLASRAFIHSAFHFDFLGVRIRLFIVVHVPAESRPKFINEILANLRFLIIRRKIPSLVGIKNRHKFSHLRKGFI